jgi:crossover junction endodeoxyribonuclease RusA
MMNTDFSVANLPRIGKQSAPSGLEPLVLWFPPPCEYLTMNQRKHWTWTSKRKRAWREAAYYSALQWRSSPADRLLDGAHLVSFRFPMATNRRRDPHNYYPTIKPIIDGLTDAGLWPDDTSEYVATMEPIFTGKSEPVVILIRKL